MTMKVVTSWFLILCTHDLFATGPWSHGFSGAEALNLQQQDKAQSRQGNSAIPFLPKKGLLSARSLRVAPSQAAQGASRLFFGAPEHEVSIGTDAGGSTFAVQKGAEPAPLVALNWGAIPAQDSVHLASPRVQVQSLESRAGYSVKRVHQWQLVRSEDFNAPPVGWNIQAVTSCGGIHMLGGYCKHAAGEMRKVFKGLPAHRQLRVKAVFHFIDRWAGESGYMKLNTLRDVTPTVVWSEMHRQKLEQTTAVSLCGKPHVAESKFTANIDVTLDHNSDTLDMIFGSTMDAAAADPCEESWGISSIEVYCRE
eukprot:TRINITY_DN111355_c0_g1_i1.p1 TRINITY_DN111355_c0_g1~~TRINITY_DN111355_c0_g1_i1.p1  ORF type:complete len:310 (-),score=82.52 TRINITY_DN111355_c0_g1_i1:100-1029(-)